MNVNVRWIASSHATCYHAAAAILAGQRLVYNDLAGALAEPVASLASALHDSGIGQDEFFQHLVPLAAGISNDRRLAEVALTKTIGRQRQQQAIDRVVGPLANLQRASTAALSGLGEKLALRAEPLRMQWEARGRGLLKEVARLTDPDILIEEADVVLVHPVLGGSGRAHLEYNSVRIEAMLADPNAELPEVLRLGWLLSMLNLDLPRYSERMGMRRLMEVAPLAMLPVVLSAAEPVELARFDEPSLRKAIQAWQCDLPTTWSGRSDSIAEPLGNWWRTYLDGGAVFSVAVGALDQLLG